MHYWCSVLSCILFKLLTGLFTPSTIAFERKEKVSIALTALLSVAFILLILNEMIPRNPQQFPNIGENVDIETNLTQDHFCRLVHHLADLHAHYHVYRLDCNSEEISILWRIVFVFRAASLSRHLAVHPQAAISSNENLQSGRQIGRTQARAAVHTTQFE